MRSHKVDINMKCFYCNATTRSKIQLNHQVICRVCIADYFDNPEMFQCSVTTVQLSSPQQQPLGQE